MAHDIIVVSDLHLGRGKNHRRRATPRERVQYTFLRVHDKTGELLH
jgi:hypothetical protein